ncbi:conserved hypothetical protein [Culex quinquefasciatus]|uniref:Retrovirus-related Pol polyprotein from transposon TNT 1-94-like beta-barrel domain-containing protein n=1 Tax=Culex quinquefasciatus TaxID=7176 RepID=B0XAT9_CULQU|nr:conserved hypothetical protein [Culex quinquefasciatus]|eukprot:XP_001866761.1 conserved hypothetical protein [Culex quinquefasciatus]
MVMAISNSGLPFKEGHIAKDYQSKNRKGQSALSTVLSMIGAAKEDEGLLENLQDGSGIVTAANNGAMKVVATGDAKLKASCCPGSPALDVHNVQLIPELTTNLLSVSEIVEKGNTVTFDKRGCQVVNPDGDVFATGIRENNLFRVDAEKQSRAMAYRESGQAELWHKWMGHLNVHGLMQEW